MVSYINEHYNLQRLPSKYMYQLNHTIHITTRLTIKYCLICMEATLTQYQIPSPCLNVNNSVGMNSD